MHSMLFRINDEAPHTKGSEFLGQVWIRNFGKPGPALQLLNQSKGLIAGYFHKFEAEVTRNLSMFSISCKKMLLKSLFTGNIRFVEGPALFVPSMKRAPNPQSGYQARPPAGSGIVGPQEVTVHPVVKGLGPGLKHRVRRQSPRPVHLTSLKSRSLMICRV
jgi:hypothetical protein